MADNHTELCEKLRYEAKAIMSSFASEDHLFAHFFEAADLIEQQAARIAELEADRDSWRDQASQRVADWDEMRKERDALKADAERWHLARDQATIYQGNNVGCFVEFKKYEAMPSERHRSGRAFTDAVDAAIDAAIMEKSDDRS